MADNLLEEFDEMGKKVQQNRAKEEAKKEATERAKEELKEEEKRHEEDKRQGMI